MTKLPCLALTLALGACGNASPIGAALDTQPARLDTVVFDVPLAWRRTDTNTPRGPSATWLPEQNTRKESLIVTRARLEPGRDAPTIHDLAEMLIGAQHELPGGHISKSEPFTTPSGMRGIRIEISFVPFGMQTTYHRSHAVLLDGKNLINVLYTAQQPDESSFDAVIGSVREES